MAMITLRAMLLALCLLLAAMAQADQASIRLLTFSEPPWVEVQDGRLQGPTIELIKELFQRAGVPYQIDVLPLKRALKEALNQPGTCVFPIERSQERETSLRWISPLVVSRYGLYAPAGHEIRLQTLEDARPYSIGSYLGSGLGEYLIERGYNVIEVSSAKLGPNMLRHKRFDLWVSDTRSAQVPTQLDKALLGQPSLVFLTTLRAMGCHPDTPTSSLELLNAALLNLLDEPDWRARVASDLP
jgi:polar amino acid transport system substrate-binding protein